MSRPEINFEITAADEVPCEGRTDRNPSGNASSDRQSRGHRRPRERMTTFEMRYRKAVELQMEQIDLQRKILEELEDIAKNTD